MKRAYPTPESVPTIRCIEHPYVPGRFLPVHRRPTRLRDVDYSSASCRCFLTYNLLPCAVRFDGPIGDLAWHALLEVRDRIGFPIHAACVMPDHVHALVSPTGKGESVGDIVKSTKLRRMHAVRDRFGYWLKWQRDFYDHVLGRPGADPGGHEAIAWYIRNNAVRAGLVADWRDYPYAI